MQGCHPPALFRPSWARLPAAKLVCVRVFWVWHGCLLVPALRLCADAQLQGSRACKEASCELVLVSAGGVLTHSLSSDPFAVTQLQSATLNQTNI